MAYNLLVETSDTEEFEYILEEKNRNDEPTLYIKGPYLMSGKENKNKRIYDPTEMHLEVKRYTTEMIDQNRAMGELNHPTSADVDLERACHMVVEMWRDDDSDRIWHGKSKVLSTPCGTIVKNLVKDGVKLGMSSRSLGKLNSGPGDVNNVSDMRLVAIDCVADPSYTDAFVNGILESKQWILDNDGTFCEFYDKFEKGLEKLPRVKVEEHLQSQILTFINNLK